VKPFPFQRYLIDSIVVFIVWYFVDSIIKMTRLIIIIVVIMACYFLNTILSDGDNNSNMIYIGSTCNSLSKRRSAHMCQFRRYSLLPDANKQKYVSSFDLIKLGDIKIELIEEVKTETPVPVSTPTVSAPTPVVEKAISTPAPVAPTDGSRILASPLAKKLAEEKGENFNKKIKKVFISYS
jgi:pyruvate/2-oxoglutarate dehydrogenase complex dihydrolipoamide acyltransferase (E2) component